MIRLVLALSAMVCLAATSAMARESGGHRSSSASKTRAAKHTKSSRSKGSTTRHKSTAARRAAGKKASAHRKGNQAHGTGEIDASTAVWEDLPPKIFRSAMPMITVSRTTSTSRLLLHSAAVHEPIV